MITIGDDVQRPAFEVRVDALHGVQILEVYVCAFCGAPKAEDEFPRHGLTAVSRVLGPVCGCCWVRLPGHVDEWAEDYERRARHG